MAFKFYHFNFNVKDLKTSLSFYKEAIGLVESRRKERENFTLVFLKDEKGSDFELELTYLHDRAEDYNLGEGEFHLAFKTDDYDEAYKKHSDMGCICYENKEMGIYFIKDPDGYWIEIVPVR